MIDFVKINFKINFNYNVVVDKGCIHIARSHVLSLIICQRKINNAYST